jgi:protein gp37
MSTSIPWTDKTWVNVTGCTDASPDCRDCYARTESRHQCGMGRTKKYPPDLTRKSGNRLVWTGLVLCHEELLDVPRHWRKPRKIFVNSMSDTFHEKVPLEFIQRIFRTMNETPRHTYQLLTKRAERMAELAPLLTWTPNIWAGVSVENADYLWRLDYLRKVPAHRRFVSMEPIIGRIGRINLEGIHWIISGGESGDHARPCDPEWVREIRDQCEPAGVAYFHKQWGTWANNPTPRHLELHPDKGGATLDGRLWCEFPA